MKRPGSVSLLLVLLAAAAPSGGAAAHGVPAPGRPAREESRPPIPPGVPTSEHNVHLPTEGEVKLGREGSAEVEKRYKVVTSGPEHDRLQRIAREVVAAIQRDDIIAEYRRVYNLPRRGDRSRRVPFEYTFKVVDTKKEINAFSLAGGPIYVTRGLMEYATSDDELAAVLAHECAHVAFHHVEQLIRKQKKANSTQIWGLLATILAGAAGGGAVASAATNVMVGAQLVSIATLTGYGRELEHEADRMGVRALTSTRYHPLAMMTFMQKLARDDRLRGNPDHGIFQTHPYSNERVAAIKQEVQRLGYMVDLGTQRQISRAFRVTPVPQRVDGRDIVELHLNGSLLFTVVAGEGELTPAERAQVIARRIEELFADNLAFNEVKQSPDRTALLLKGIPVIRPHPDDAAVMGTAEAVVEKAYREIVRALLKEQIDRPF